MKRLVKFAVAFLFHYSGLTYLRLRMLRKNRPALILMYHRVLADDDPDRQYIQPGLYVTPQVFDRQLSFLSKRFKIISLGELAESILNGTPIPKNCVVVTFDDGWGDNYNNAFPIMKRYNIPATIFVAIDFIGTGNVPWFYLAGRIMEKAKFSPERFARILHLTNGAAALQNQPEKLTTLDRIEVLKTLDHESIMAIIRQIASEADLSETDLSIGNNIMLNWEQVVEMNREGIEFGSHGCSHRIMTGLERAQVIEEIMRSKKVAESKLGREVILFSYPNGNYNPDIQALVREAGYKCAVVTRANADDNNEYDIFALKRIGVHQDISIGPNGRFSRAMFAFHISGWSTLFGKRKERG